MINIIKDYYLNFLDGANGDTSGEEDENNGGARERNSVRAAVGHQGARTRARLLQVDDALRAEHQSRGDDVRGGTFYSC